jgi:hydrophobic/amphiphilic exporter-1 (mainly G- bacteria), HAE1 family
MFISDVAIKRPLVTTVVMILIVTFGIAALLALDTDEYPDVVNPMVSVVAVYPGASPQQVEREVVNRLEEQFNGITGLDHMESTSRDGIAEITLSFKFTKNVDVAAQDVRDAIAEVRDNLPAEMREPMIRKIGLTDAPIVSLALTSETLTPAELTLVADPGITRVLRGITGVAQVTVNGADDRTIAVNVRPRDLEAAHVSIGEVVNALTSENLAAPVGNVTGPLTERTIRLNGHVEQPQDFLRLVVANRGGQLIRLSQVASVEDTAVEARSLALFDGRPGVGIDITKASGVSTTRVADAVRAQLATLTPTLPPGVTLSLVNDAGVRVRHSVQDVELTLVAGALLTVLVVFIFLNSWRSTVITGLALPVSTLAAFIAVWACGFTLNTMSLLGLSLAIGILIDDAIVVRENIVRHVELGEDHFTAAHTGTNEIGLAVTATTFSIVAVFVPVAFMNGLAGQWFKPFALTIACAVLVSLFVSFSLDPMLSAYWPDPQLEGHARRSAVARALHRFNAWFDAQADRYKTVIAWALDHRWLMVAVAVGSFAAAVSVQWLRKNDALVPITDRSELTVVVETPAGSNLDYIRLKMQELDRLLRAHPEVAYTYATVGSGATTGEVDAGQIYVRLVPKSKRRISQRDFAAEVRRDVTMVGGVTAYVFAEAFLPTEKQIQIQVRGDDEAALNTVATEIMQVVASVPGATDVGLSNRGERPELHIDLDRALAAQLGVSVADVAHTLRPAFAGIHAGDWVDPTGKTRDVTVRLAPDARANTTDLSQMPLVLNGGQSLATVPLGAVATISNQLGPAEIDHYDRDQVVTVGANLQGRPLSQVSDDIHRRLSSVAVPPSVRIVEAGQSADLSGVIHDIAATVALAILLMYMILVVQFGSFLDPLAIMLSLPLSLIGVVLALLLPGGQLDIMSILGVILLFGIVTKNAILLIDFAIWSKAKKGMSTRDALIEAGRIRLRPIMMTTVALIAGMVPVAMGAGEGGDFRAGLGRAVIGGVITSTLLTLLVIPTFYEILDDWRTRALARLKRHGPRKAVHAVPEGAPGD